MVEEEYIDYYNKYLRGRSYRLGAKYEINQVYHIGDMVDHNRYIVSYTKNGEFNYFPYSIESLVTEIKCGGWILLPTSISLSKYLTLNN